MVLVFLFLVCGCCLASSPSRLKFSKGRLSWLPPPVSRIGQRFVSSRVQVRHHNNKTSFSFDSPSAFGARLAGLDESKCFSFRVRLLDDHGAKTAFSAWHFFCTPPRLVQKPVWLTGASLFRTAFEVPANVEYAVWHVSGLGCFEAALNGDVVSDLMGPAWSRTEYRVLFSSLKLSLSNRSCLAVELGSCHYSDNWYGGSPLKASFWSKLVLQFKNGSSTEFPLVWSSKVEGPIIDSSIYGGETFNARLVGLILFVLFIFDCVLKPSRKHSGMDSFWIQRRRQLECCSARSESSDRATGRAIV
jgi:hypothetical protein